MAVAGIGIRKLYRAKRMIIEMNHEIELHHVQNSVMHLALYFLFQTTTDRKLEDKANRIVLK